MGNIQSRTDCEGRVTIDTYDRAGNVHTKTNGIDHDFDETYAYNGIDELMSADRAAGDDQSWNLDGLGGRKRGHH